MYILMIYKEPWLGLMTVNTEHRSHRLLSMGHPLIPGWMMGVEDFAFVISVFVLKGLTLRDWFEKSRILSKKIRIFMCGIYH